MIKFMYHARLNSVVHTTIRLVKFTSCDMLIHKQLGNLQEFRASTHTHVKNKFYKLTVE